MNITEKTRGKWTLLALEGRIDSQGAVDLDLALQAALADGKQYLLLDLRNVPYINSSGLRALADVLTQLQKDGGDLQLVDMHPKVKRVFEIIGFDNFFTIHETLETVPG